MSAESADGTPDPAASSITGACRFLYSWTGTEMQVFVPEADGECDGGDISPLVMIVHDGGPFVTSGGNFKSYQYLQRHLAKNGFISASIAVRSEDAHETALNVVDLMVDFLTDAWRRAPLVDTDSVALVGHGRGTEVTRHIARQLEGHPLFVVRSIISLAPVVEGPALRRDEANAHLQLLLAGPSAPGSLPAGSSELARQDQLGSVLKVIEGGSGRGLVDGGGLLNDVVKGYALAFLAAEHYGIDTWYDQFIRGTRVPGFWTTPVHTAIELGSPEHDQRTVARP
ncbi:MAG: hypothetical protein KC731_16075 [Myxococcales bacterium]|nr:hypothetical protein [Myxococcales bacterium]